MIVTNASFTLSATHAQASRHEEHVEVRVFGRSDGNARPTGHNARVSTPAEPPGALKRPDHPHASQATPEAAAQDDGLDPQLALLKSIIERLTGRLLETFDADALQPAASAPDSPPTGAAPAPPPALRGLRVTTQHEYSEHETMTFRARGTIATADGRHIDFAVQLQMQRSFVERSSAEIVWGDVPELKDPLVINFDGAAALTADRHAFDLDADGTLDAIPGLAAGRAFLVLDRNGNGRVDDGGELIGALSGDAFAELAALDQDGNGFVDQADASFAQLGLWRPGSANDAFDDLQTRDVAALSTRDVSTDFKLADAANAQLGQLRATSIYLTEDARVGTTQQVDLLI